MTESQDRVIDLFALRNALNETLEPKQGLTLLRSLIRDLLIRDGVDVAEADDEVIMEIVYRLDAAESDAALRTLAASYARLLREDIPRSQLALLAPVIATRERLSEVLLKVSRGDVTSESFGSFLDTKRWGADVKLAIMRLPRAGLEELRHAVIAEDYSAAASLLFRI